LNRARLGAANHELLFTVHSGEYLVGAHIERRFKRVNVWVPSQDTGVDLLASDRQNRHALSLQAKFGKDSLVTHMKAEFQQPLRACRWWSIDQDELRKSPADFWEFVFVLVGFARRTTDFVIVPTTAVEQRLGSIHGSQRMIQSFLWVTNRDRCWETRGLRRADQLQIANGNYRNASRDFSNGSTNGLQ
jgi:hypothetical protein